ncbi:MAG: long-chain fatty acid--CoA ligase [Elusimicrobia bacterium]|jgi:long-chain acyl-CoA synthetase|nr:long-chain fatty acid--CoA ligase [Elusimicrobiota bacterium]
MTKTLHRLLADTARRSPDAVVFYYRGKVWTYGQLEEKVGRCAAGLSSRGVGRGDTFGIVLRNAPEFVVLFFALARLGAIAVPVNFLERGERIGSIFSDAGVKGCLTSREFLTSVREAQKTCPSLQHVFLKDNGDAQDSFDRLLDPSSPLEGDPSLGEDALALLIYTAGTTGLPKGVMLTHGNFMANVESCRQAIEVSEKDRFLCLLPMFHSFSWTVNVLLPIRLGSPIVIMESLLPFDPVLKAIWEHKVTVFCGVPPIFSALTQKVRGIKALALRVVNPVRVAISGAAALPPAVLTAFEKTFHIPLLEGYGLTEAAPVVAVNPLHKDRKAGTVGVAVPGVQIKLVDDNERSLPPMEVGEVCVRGANVMAGYYKRPEETRASFTKDGWLKTGDLGRLDEDGYLSIVDRKKDMVIVKGLNVYPVEIERALESHPAVEEAAVVGFPDETGDETIVAFIVFKEGKTCSKVDLLDHGRKRLAPYKIPKDFEFWKELPKNAIGKILKKDLRLEAQAKRRKT